MTAYYNEIDPRGAASLRELIRAGIIAPGDVDDRSIKDVRPSDLAGYVQCHFFAGIGVWSYALRCAGWPDDRPVWTGSLPCQPFSAAGKGEGFADERHLWPSFFHLARVRRPVALFGEQVSSKDGLAWFDHVRSDLEGEGYTVGVSDTCAAGFGAPHIRQRLYFVADAASGRRQCQPSSRPSSIFDETNGSTEQREQSRLDSPSTRLLADAESLRGREGLAHGAGSGERGCEEQGAVPVGNGNPRLLVQSIGFRIGGGDQRGLGDPREEIQEQENGTNPAIEPRHGSEDADLLVHALQPGLEGHAGDERDGNEPGRQRTDEARPIAEASGPCNGFWSNALWIPCRDGKHRPIEPGTFPLAHGAAERVGRLHGYGNAIVAPQAEAFVRAYIEVTK